VCPLLSDACVAQVCSSDDAASVPAYFTMPRGLSLEDAWRQPHEQRHEKARPGQSDPQHATSSHASSLQEGREAPAPAPPGSSSLMRALALEGLSSGIPARKQTSTIGALL
jgi:hypothetical protein